MCYTTNNESGRYLLDIKQINLAKGQYMRVVALWLLLCSVSVMAQNERDDFFVWTSFLQGASVPVDVVQEIRLDGPEDSHVPPLCYASLQNNEAAVRMLLDAGINPGQPLHDWETYGWLSEIHCVSVFYGENGNEIGGESISIHPQILELILNDLDITHLQPSEQYLLFELAMLSDDVVLASGFIMQGFPVNWNDEFGNNLLVHSLWSQSYKISELLLDHGAIPEEKPIRKVGADSDPARLIEKALEIHREEPETTDLLLRIQRKISHSQLIKSLI